MKQLFRLAPIAVMIALVVPAVTPSVASASPVDQQRNEVERIVDELERLEERANDIGEAYVEAVDAKSHLDAEIVELEVQIAGKEAELVELRADLGDMAIRSFVGAGTTPLGPLFEDTANINDALQRDQLARVALSAGDVTTDELDAFVEDLEADRAELDDKRDQAQDLADSLVGQQDETERLTGEYTQARVDAEAKLGELIVEEEARRAAESLARVQAEAEQAAAAAAPPAQSTNNGGGGNSDNNDSANTNNGGANTASNGGDDDSSGNGGGGSPAPAAAPAAPAAAAAAPAPAPAPAAPPPSSRSSVAVNAALSQQGVPYKYATEAPGVNFDCSGLTKYAWGQAGVYLPHQSRQQFASIPHVDPGSAQPGDLIFYYSPISHVGVYIGGGQQVHAPNTGSVVNIGNVNWNKVTGVGRPG